uniref:Titin n=1 Tax=Strigops habroptila TaxID=2489341 RepID=A0A672TFS1_STRHB
MLPPEIELDAELRKVVTIRACCTLRLFVPIKGRPAPEVKWAREHGESLDRASIESTSSYTLLIVENVNRFDSGKYILTIENSSGSKSAFVNVRVLDTPGAPQDLKIKEVTKSSVTLTWEPPLIDGGSKIKNYIVEKRESTRKAYSTVNANCHKTSWKVDSLQEGCNYYFRVLAENEYGIGLPVETSESIKVSERPLPPGKITLLDVTSNSVSLSWEKPEHDGGSRILGYIVEMQSKGSEKWSTCATVKVTEATITGLIQGEEYTFRVSAQNEKGISDPRQLGIPVVAKDLVIPPAFKLLFTTFSVLAGEDLKVDVPFVGRPKPAVFWHKDDIALKQTTRVNAESSENNTVLTIKEACNKRLISELRYRVTGLIENHDYEYRVSAENAAGLSEPSPPSIYYKACDPIYKPGPPNNPKVVDVTRSSVFLSWGKPIYDGGSEIQGYIVEKCDVSDGEWAICTPPTGIKNTHMEVEKLVEKHEYKFRICAVNKAGVGEHADVPGSVVVEEKMEAPDLDLDMELRKIVNVRAGGSLRLFVPIRGRPTPEVKWGKMDGDIREAAIIDTTIKWEKAEGRISERTQIEVTSSYTMLVIDNVNRFDSGRYNLTLENNSGKKSAFVNVRVLDTPSAPINLTIREVKKDFVTLAWEPPLIDGGAKITNYVVEKRESTRKAYATVTNNCTKNSFKVTQLQEGCSYYFRVLAVNEYGVGLPAETPDPVKVSEPPSPPAKVILVDVTRNSASIKWEKPESDGGSKITGYIVEMQTKGSIKWSACTQVKTLEATITGLSMGEEYSFRVIAVNEKGKSDPRELGVPVIAKDIEIQPSAELLFNTFTVKAGDDLKIDVPFRGRPLPTVSWKKDGNPLKETTRVNIHTSKTSTSLSIKEASNEDLGHYELRLSNTAGSTTASLTVVVLDRPGPPTDPKIMDSTRSNITIGWTKPLFDGGAPVTGYTVEYKKTDETDWTTAIQNLRGTEYTISGLVSGSEYVFRVKSINKIGVSEPSDVSEPQMAKEREEEPAFDIDSEMRKTLIVKAGGSFTMTVPFRGKPVPNVTWNKPDTDLRIRASIDTSDSCTSLTIEKATRNDSGKYTLTLQNVLNTATLTLIVKVLDTPGPPSNIAVKDVTKESAVLSWDVPENDGGAPVRNYVIEKREASKKAWVTVTNNCHRLSYKVTGLQEGAIYYFRVSGENEYGVGAPSETKEGTKITGECY